MNIEEKLLLSARPGKLSLIREGLFLRCYQQSLFSWVHAVYPEMKILGRTVKKRKGQGVYYGGFPQTVLHKILPDSVPTPRARRLTAMGGREGFSLDGGATVTR